MVRTVTEDDTGLKVLREPTESTLTESTGLIDIVALHGIGAHPDDTWCKNIAPDAEEKKYVNWLEDEKMLPLVVPQARIMRYGYESQWFGDEKSSTVRLRASTIAEQLLHELNFEREEFPFRPLVFISHCFGGLVVLKALRQALDNEGKWPGVFKSTTGLLFFGTPFRGTEGMNQSEMIEAALSQYPGNVRGESLRILGAGDEFLQEIVGKFLETRSRPHPAQVACFYETKSSNVGAIVGGTAKHEFVVNESSGCLDHTDSVEKYPLARTHFDINKFGKVTEPSYRLVSRVVKKMAVSAPEILSARTEYKDKHKVPFTAKGLPITRFVEREAEMSYLESHLGPGLPEVTRQKAVVIYGLGGMGKTQLALGYARKYHEEYSAVLWLDGSTESQLKQSFVKEIQRLPKKELSANAMRNGQLVDDNVDVVARCVLEWLSLPSNKHWLLIVDNVDLDYHNRNADSQSYDVKSYLPEGYHGSVIITSRLANLARNFEVGLKVGKVDDQQAGQILEKNAGKKIHHTQIILERLRGLPLALAQAGAYIAHTGMDGLTYIKHYDNTWRSLMEKQQGQFPLPEYDERSVLTTWTLSYAQVKQQNEAAAGLMRLWAFFNSEDLWSNLISAISSNLDDIEAPRWLFKLAGSELEFMDAVGLLSRFCLAESREQTSSFSMHAVLHQWCYHLSAGAESTMLFLAAACGIANLTPSKGEREYWKLQRRLLPHGLRLMSADSEEFAQHLPIPLVDHQPNWAPDRVCQTLGSLFRRQGKFTESETMLNYAFELRTKLSGSQDIGTLGIGLDRGVTYERLGKLSEAEKTYKEVLDGFETKLGPLHRSTLSVFHNFGNLYRKQCRLTEAEGMYTRALEGKEKVLGYMHSSTLETVDALGNLYRKQCKLLQAEHMHTRALEGREKLLGPMHVLTLQTVHCFGHLYGEMNMPVQAEQMNIRALEGREEALGPTHIFTLETVNNLGNDYADQGKLADAEKMYMRALRGKEKGLGPGHRSTLRTARNLRRLYESQGRLAEARELKASYQRPRRE